MISMQKLLEFSKKNDDLTQAVDTALAVKAGTGKKIPFFLNAEVLVDTARSDIFSLRETTFQNTAEDLYVEEFAPYVRYRVSSSDAYFNTQLMSTNMSFQVATSSTAVTLVDFQWNVTRGSAFNALLPPTQQLSTMLSRNAMGFYSRNQTLKFEHPMYVRAGEPLTVKIQPTLCMARGSTRTAQEAPRFLVFGIAMTAVRNAERPWPTARDVQGDRT